MNQVNRTLYPGRYHSHRFLSRIQLLLWMLLWTVLHTSPATKASAFLQSPFRQWKSWVRYLYAKRKAILHKVAPVQGGTGSRWHQQPNESVSSPHQHITDQAFPLLQIRWVKGEAHCGVNLHCPGTKESMQLLLCSLVVRIFSFIKCCLLKIFLLDCVISYFSYWLMGIWVFCINS